MQYILRSLLSQPSRNTLNTCTCPNRVTIVAEYSHENLSMLIMRSGDVVLLVVQTFQQKAVLHGKGGTVLGRQ